MIQVYGSIGHHTFAICPGISIKTPLRRLPAPVRDTVQQKAKGHIRQTNEIDQSEIDLLRNRPQNDFCECTSEHRKTRSGRRTEIAEMLKLPAHIVETLKYLQ